MKEAEFHKAVGGRIREDQRFTEMSEAAQIRQILVDLRSNFGWFYRDIAKLLGTSISTLSMAAGGRAGSRINKDGQSTTQRLLEGLLDLTSMKKSETVDGPVRDNGR